MKKLLLFLLIVSTVLSLTACGRTVQPITLDAETESYLNQTILDYNKDLYYKERASYANEIHTVLETETAEDTTTIYAWVLYSEWQLQDGKAIDIAGGHIPTAITFKTNPDGSRELLEYWQPLDGSAYEKSIRNRFPRSAIRKLWALEASQGRFDAARKDAETYFANR